MEGTLSEILPPEVLGWLLLKRSGLSSQSRLSIQAAAANSMKFDDVERAMRQQEDELMHHERTRGVQQKGHHGSYWIEHEGNWGLVLQDVDEMEQLKDDEVKWLDGSAFAATVIGGEEASTYEACCGKFEKGQAVLRLRTVLAIRVALSVATRDMTTRTAQSVEVNRLQARWQRWFAMWTPFQLSRVRPRMQCSWCQMQGMMVHHREFPNFMLSQKNLWPTLQ